MEIISEAKLDVIGYLSWLASVQKDHGEVWFRGQGTVTEPLPGLLRPAASEALRLEDERSPFLGDRMVSPGMKSRTTWRAFLQPLEGRLNQSFATSSAPFWDRQLDSVSVYWNAQHHGLPTRLLDWTVLPLAALYFALSAMEGVGPGVVYALRAEAALTVLWQTDPLLHDRISRLFDDYTIALAFDDTIESRQSTIYGVRPRPEPGRMVGQGSRFTFHWGDPISFPDQATQGLEIPAHNRESLMNELRLLGVDRQRLFPEPDSVVRDIKVAWRLP